MRTMTRNAALIVLLALVVGGCAATAVALDGHPAPAASSGPTAPATFAKQAPLQVYGDRTWPLERSIAYWNDFAGRQVIRYAGPRMDQTAANDPHTVVVMFDGLTNTSGVTFGVIGRSPQAITIDPRAMFEWWTYVRELGHALGFQHDDRPGV